MQQLTDWLMAGDPAIRWQTQRYLLGAPDAVWCAERQRTAAAGWGAQFLAHQDADGRWGSGVYSPKWVSTTYTLLVLIGIGIPPSCDAAQRGAHRVLNELLGAQADAAFHRQLAGLDRCIVGMVLQIGVYFGIDDARIELIVENLLAEMMPDGAWNCRRHRRPAPQHSSFHTTLNVLEGLRIYAEQAARALKRDVLAAEHQAREFLLQHRLYRSDHSGAVIDPKFTMLSYPPRWHYDVLRGLSYFARAGAPRDARLQDAVALLKSRRRPDQTWPVQQRYAGKEFFVMEKTGGPSRWNTLRALRVLRWWEAP
ncbi:MAG: hypothetical protein IAE81_23525 [Caldilineaceae bacterium]|jgi:hypothetical protein|nr:hypothetical protein [Caldilineaceae bacterium]